jgi:hypothetical protein
MHLPTLSALRIALADIQTDASIRSVLLFASGNDLPAVHEIESVLAVNHKPLLGGVFPEIIADGTRQQSGFVLIALQTNIDVHLVESPSEVPFLTKDRARWAESVFCFVNAFWPEKQNFLTHLYDALGPFVNYLGGGAGSLSFQSMPCVFANGVVAEHAAVVGLMDVPMSIGVAHGWHPISDPIKVTETRGNTILSLNWRPAFDVYSELIASHSGQRITKETFFDIAKSYPLGLVTLDNEMRIRDPFATDNGELHIVDEVPEGEYIRIMHGDLDSLLTGARHAIGSTLDSTASEMDMLCIDCISRVLFMQEEFAQELSILNSHGSINGILSIGEIANPGNAALELFNKTVVVAQWAKTN